MFNITLPRPELRNYPAGLFRLIPCKIFRITVQLASRILSVFPAMQS